MFSRRDVLRNSVAASVALSSLPGCLRAKNGEGQLPLSEFGYGDVQLAPGPAQSQFEHTRGVLLRLNDDSLLKPWRLRAGLPAPGPELGGWYDELPLEKTPSGGHGFAPAHSFGQWISALSRGYAVDKDAATKAKLEKLLALYEPAISEKFYVNFRYPAYNYDKMVIGLIDAHQFAQLPQAHRILEKTTDAAERRLPPQALDRDEPQRKWRESMSENTTNDYTWDESYTLAENLYLAWTRGAGDRYRTLARRFLLDKTYFTPLSEGRNVLPKHHAYSFCNALSSAMQAYLADGSEMHLRAGSNAFDMIEKTQSFATGAWGPNESFVEPDSGELLASLSTTHRGFETPCGSYAHFKLTRYLLRITRDGRYGDSMERVFYNTVLGAKALETDGRAFYYSDYHFGGQKTYFPDAWPCCSGTLPQVTADYRLLSYFREPNSVYVNLYLPSTLKWTTDDGAQATLSQSGTYPLSKDVTMRLQMSRPSRFALRLRVPAWSGSGTTVRVNGHPAAPAVRKGFAPIDRQWKDGDRVEVTFRMATRLDAIDPKHPNMAALVRGPLVLFALGEDAPQVQADELLAATQTERDETLWQSKAGGATLQLRPFFAIKDERYNAYLKTSRS